MQIMIECTASHCSQPHTHRTMEFNFNSRRRDSQRPLTVRKFQQLLHTKKPQNWRSKLTQDPANSCLILKYLTNNRPKAAIIRQTWMLGSWSVHGFDIENKSNTKCFWMESTNKLAWAYCCANSNQYTSKRFLVAGNSVSGTSQDWHVKSIRLWWSTCN